MCQLCQSEVFSAEFRSINGRAKDEFNIRRSRLRNINNKTRAMRQQPATTWEFCSRQVGLSSSSSHLLNWFVARSIGLQMHLIIIIAFDGLVFVEFHQSVEGNSVTASSFNGSLQHVLLSWILIEAHHVSRIENWKIKTNNAREWENRGMPNAYAFASPVFWNLIQSMCVWVCVWVVSAYMHLIRMGFQISSSSPPTRYHLAFVFRMRFTTTTL